MGYGTGWGGAPDGGGAPITNYHCIKTSLFAAYNIDWHMHNSAYRDIIEQFHMKPAHATTPSNFFQIHIFNRSHGNYVVCTISLSESLWFMNNLKSKFWILQILSWTASLCKAVVL